MNRPKRPMIICNLGMRCGKTILTDYINDLEKYCDVLEERCNALEKSLDKACERIVDGQNEDCYVGFCFKGNAYNDCDYHNCPGSKEWKDYFLKEVIKNGK